jgi:predicted transposase/invertase (TIGR01784 family)
MDIDGDIKRAEERLEYLSADPQTQELYFEREKAIHDQANIYSTGVRRGMEQGMAQGIELGLNQGRSEGITEGENKKEIEMIQKFIQKGWSDTDISDFIDLPIDKIIDIRNSLN